MRTFPPILSVRECLPLTRGRRLFTRAARYGRCTGPALMVMMPIGVELTGTDSRLSGPFSESGMSTIRVAARATAIRAAAATVGAMTG